MQTENYVQIDVLIEDEHITGNAVRCLMYTPFGCMTIFMKPTEYKRAVRDGFFIRDGKVKDSAGVLNTTIEYYSKP